MDSSSANAIVSARQALLAELLQITSLERGTLAEEFRTGPNPNGKGVVRRGPYFKHQCWEDGKNRSSRVPPQQVDELRQDLANGQRFDQITEQLAALAITQSRNSRAAGQVDSEEKASKKNSRRTASKSASRKPKRSSPSSKSTSRRKA
jgi:hypothetical protein